jgi:Uncharacterized conserved protein (DUF2190)
MPNNECIPVFEPADRLTGKVTPVGGVRGKRFVAVSADVTGGLYGTENVNVAECGAGVRPVGVSAYDGVQNEQIPLITDHSWVPMPAGAAITAGQEVQSDAQGRPIPLAAGRPCGLAITSQGTVDADVLIKLYS